MTKGIELSMYSVCLQGGLRAAVNCGWLCEHDKAALFDHYRSPTVIIRKDTLIKATYYLSLHTHYILYIIFHYKPFRIPTNSSTFSGASICIRVTASQCVGNMKNAIFCVTSHSSRWQLCERGCACNCTAADISLDFYYWRRRFKVCD